MGETAVGASGAPSRATVDMNLPAFYRDQARLYWQWRATRLALIRRALLSCVAAAAALLIVAATSSNLTFDGPVSLVSAALLLAVPQPAGPADAAARAVAPARVHRPGRRAPDRDRDRAGDRAVRARGSASRAWLRLSGTPSC